MRHYGLSQNLKLSLLLSEISSKLNLPSEEIKTLFQDLEHQQLLELKIRESDLSITFLEPREDDKTIKKIRNQAKNISKKEDQTENRFYKTEYTLHWRICVYEAIKLFIYNTNVFEGEVINLKSLGLNEKYQKRSFDKKKIKARLTKV